MNPDPFEQQLQRRTLPQLPPDWRAEILGAAAEARVEQARTETSATDVPWRYVRWGALAAMWVAIACISILEPTPEATLAVAQSNPAKLEHRWQEHLRVVAEWAEPPITQPPAPPPPPRSGWRPSRTKTFA